MNADPTVLIVEDDRDLAEIMVFALRRAGFGVLAAHDSWTALRLFQDERPAVVVLDVNLGEVATGFDVLRDMRRLSNTPVIMLTSRDAEEDKLRGLELGADDYITKPFSHRELAARIRVQLRHAGRAIDEPALAPVFLEVGPIRLDARDHSVTIAGRPVNLTVTELRFLRYLLAHPGTVIPRRVLLREVWGPDQPDDPDLLRVMVHRLRRKLEDDPTNPQLIITVPRVGILLRANQS